MGFLRCVGEGLCPSRGRPQGSPLQKRYKKCGEAGRCRHRPLRSVTRGAMGGRPQGSPLRRGYKRRGGAGRCRHRPLRKRNKRCSGRATARVAPTEALQVVRWGGPMWASSPTECLPIEFRRGRCPHRPASVTRGAVRGRNPPVTASPCQPPLGKGAEGTGDADCHGRVAPSQ